MADGIYKDFLTYKGRPLVRNGNFMYYGSLADKYVVFMMIHDSREIDGKEVSGKIQIELQYTDPSVKDRVVKTSTKTGLYAALDLASVWLDMAK